MAKKKKLNTKKPKSGPKSRKLKPTDGLGPHEIKRIRNALRDVWRYSCARKMVVKRCTGKDGFTYCEKCERRTPQFKVDHIIKCGDVDGGYIRRLFCPSNQLQGLCKSCHDEKTKKEREDEKTKKEREDEKRKDWNKDFY